uniref:Uncharacterized protein n=1 Tax=Amphimedon queenslandica TaxID=400682 RepID=A0A1X7U0Q1_AMPQE
MVADINFTVIGLINRKSKTNKK